MDAWFLVHNPGWTWRDLQETPERVLRFMKVIETAGVQHSGPTPKASNRRG